jgi:hypothetical protein
VPSNIGIAAAYIIFILEVLAISQYWMGFTESNAVFEKPKE